MNATLATVALILAVFAQAVARPVAVKHDGKPVEAAEVRCGDAVGKTDKAGNATIVVPPAGCMLVVTKDGLAPLSQPVTAGTGGIEVTLEELPEVEEAVVVSATRSGRLASDQPLRVEVVGREEIQEKLLMTPGDIAMLLNETSGIRLQATSPALGAATLRVQGLHGRYTAVLTDGLPINNTQVSALGLLQVPPMDLKQVEVIKGAASALYGAAALGGVINLVSRSPAERHEGEALFNVTSRGGTDSVLWLSGPSGAGNGYTLLAGAHTQNARDVDDDGWSDLPRYRRAIARPRFVRTAGNFRIEATGGLIFERRTGGSTADEGFVQSVETWRRDAGAIVRHVSGQTVIAGRGSMSFIRHDHRHGTAADRDRHGSHFGELSVSRAFGSHSFVAGAAVDHQTFSSGSRADLDYAWTTPGLFLQDDWTIHPSWSVSASARVDRHPIFGTFASPRLSSLVRLGGWDTRVSYGAGFFAPAPLTEEVDEVGIGRVTVPAKLEAERGRTWSVDVSRRINMIDLSVTAFGSRVTGALAAEPANDRLVLFNRTAATRATGAEVFGRLRQGPWVATASHAWIRATEVDRDGRRADVPLTPRRTWSFVGAWEQHGRARIGLEIYRTGRQRLEDNPYAATSAPYTIVGVLAERRVGRIRLFINLENLTDVRLSNTHPLLLPVPSATGRRTVDAWAPLEGRTLNGGVRLAW
jgi:outer membrane receptor for ferrienterochelin and colicins